MSDDSGEGVLCIIQLTIAADGIKILVVIQRSIAAAEQHRYAA
jgi:hypothetical protein